MIRFLKTERQEMYSLNWKWCHICSNVTSYCLHANGSYWTITLTIQKSSKHFLGLVGSPYKCCGKWKQSREMRHTPLLSLPTQHAVPHTLLSDLFSLLCAVFSKAFSRTAAADYLWTVALHVGGPWFTFQRKWPGEMLFSVWYSETCAQGQLSFLKEKQCPLIYI